MNKKINRLDFIDMVYEKLKQTGHFVPKHIIYWTNKAFVDCLIDVLENGDTLQVYGAFMIKPKLVKERKFNNFGKPKIIPQHYVACLKPSRRMKEACENLMDREKETIEDE